MTTPSFPSLLQIFFTARLMQQRQASPHTIASYGDSFRRLLQCSQMRHGVAPQKLAFEQVDAPLIAAFLEEMRTSRSISAGSRNLRLTAIRSFFRDAMPLKGHSRKMPLKSKEQKSLSPLNHGDRHNAKRRRRGTQIQSTKLPAQPDQPVSPIPTIINNLKRLPDAENTRRQSGFGCVRSRI